MSHDGGFMPPNIQPLDFVAVYQSNLERQAVAAAGGDTADATPEGEA